MLKLVNALFDPQHTKDVLLDYCSTDITTYSSSWKNRTLKSPVFL